MFGFINCLCLLACAVAYVACSSDSGTAVPQQASSYDEPDSSYEGSSSLYDSRDGCGTLCSIGYSSNSMGEDHFNSLSVSSTSPSISSPSETSSSSSSYTQPISYGTLVDTRDGQTYKTVTIGNQIWMAENLNYATAEKSYCYGGVAANCDKYGRLYTWPAAMDSAGTWSTNGKGCGYGSACSVAFAGSATLVRGVCPEGWHLPTQTEWETLFTAVGGQSTAGQKLKAASGWTAYSGIINEDAFGFSALPAGDDLLGYYHGEGNKAHFWSSTEYNSRDAYYMRLYCGNDYAYLEDHDSKHYGFSVRCLKD